MSYLQENLPNVPVAAAASIRQHVLSGGYPAWDNSEETAKVIAVQLCQRELIANPQPAKQVPKPMSVVGIFGALSDEGKALVKSFGPSGQEPIRNDINAGDREAVAIWATINLSTEDATAVQAELQQTIDDPAHPAQVLEQSPLQKLCGCGGISAAEVTYILNQGE